MVQTFKSKYVKKSKSNAESICWNLYKRILAKYLLYYNENEFKLVNPIKSKIGYEEEKWKKEEPKKKRQKGFYFEKTANFGVDLNLKNIKGKFNKLSP